MATKVKVSISSTGISVDKDPVKINKDTSVDWECDAGTQFNIVFPSGGGRIKSSGTSGSAYVVSSDNFSNTTGNKKTVKYDVKSGSLHLDPDVEIQP